MIIKSIQSGLVVTEAFIFPPGAVEPVQSVTVNISPVNLSKAYLKFNCYAYTATSSIQEWGVRGHFVDNSTIQLRRYTAAGRAYINWFVIEYE